MTKPKVVLTHWVHPEVVEYLEPHCEVAANPTRESLPPGEILRRTANADALMVFMPDRIDDRFLAACPRLRIVAAALKGFDNFDVQAATRRGVWFSFVPDLLSAPTAELTLALMLSLARHVLPGDAHVRSGAFRGWRPTFYGQGMQGRIVGILGMGGVGRALARRLKGFGARVVYHDTRPLPAALEREHGIERTDPDWLIAESDYLVPLLPLNRNTRHMINAHVLERVKPGCLLINACRGSVVDEEAVARFLALGRLAGYAADVFEMEDRALPDRPRRIPETLLADTQHTLFTPHLGSAVEDMRLAIAMQAARNIVQALAGAAPDDAVNAPSPIPAA